MPLNLTPQLNQAIPGFTAATGQSSKLIRELLSGRLTSGERREIFDAGASRATAGGMPGSTGSGGSLFANSDLRNIGRKSGERQQQGFQDLLSMLGAYSGTVVPTTGQELQDQQFQQDLGFRNTQADRNFGLAQNAEDLAAAEYNERYGPRRYSREMRPASNSLAPGGLGPEYEYYQTPSGRRANNPTSLMFSYRNRGR